MTIKSAKYSSNNGVNTDGKQRGGFSKAVSRSKYWGIPMLVALHVCRRLHLPLSLQKDMKVKTRSAADADPAFRNAHHLV